MRQFLFIALFGLMVSSIANAQECADLQIDGTWKTANQPTFFSKFWRTYKITQDGCYVLVYDTHRKATWKIDLSGGHTIHVPKEQVDANLHGGGPTAAKNMADLEISLKPVTRFPTQNFYQGVVTADPYLEEQKSFPVSLKAHFGAELFIDGLPQSGSCYPYCGPQDRHIQMKLTKFNVIDITKGLPANIDKESFLSGINMVAGLFVRAFSYKLTLLDLVKDQ